MGLFDFLSKPAHKEWDQIFFAQNDQTSDWFDLPYWRKGVSGSGCGLVCYTMAVNMLAGTDHTPRTMYDLRGGAEGCWLGSDLTASSTLGQLEDPPLTHREFSQKHFGLTMGTMRNLDFGQSEAEKAAAVEECLGKLRRGLGKGRVYFVTRGGGDCFKNARDEWEYHERHYVLLYRYDARTRTFFIHDPSGDTPQAIALHQAVPYSEDDMRKVLGFRTMAIGWMEPDR
ncbi:MAG: hypothetical protein Q4D06_04165 [Coriobacteriia bacterium]|nr:hypothetical protein [Coriobacteriia bacterium]